MRNIFWLFPRKEVHPQTDEQYILNLPNQGDTDWTDLDVNTAGSGYVPEKAEAVIVSVLLADTGFPAGDAYVYLRRKGDVAIPQQSLLRPSVEGKMQGQTQIVGLGSQGYLQYMIEASGTTTATLQLRLASWIEPHV